eukprot:UN04780
MWSSSSNFGNGGQPHVQSFSSSTVTRMGPDGVARTEHEEEEIVDDGTGPKKHKKVVEKKVLGQAHDQAHLGKPVAEVQRVESDLTTGETKVVHKRQIGDKERERIQHMNLKGQLAKNNNNNNVPNAGHVSNNNHNGEYELTTPGAMAYGNGGANQIVQQQQTPQATIVENLYNLNPNEVDQFDNEFNSVKQVLENPQAHRVQQQQRKQQEEEQKRGWW